ncbi:endo-1,4-beta-xylanase [Paenibacillus nanensis]
MSRKLRQAVTVFLTAALLIPSGWFAPAAEAADPEIPVILYHRIVENATDDWTHTSAENFNKQMKYLNDNGYDTLSAEQYVSILEGTEEAPDKPILLTFDDATPDFVTHALPVLKQYGMHSVQFVISDWIGGGYSMTATQLEALADEPSVSLQNHSKTHNQSLWTSSITKEQAAEEISAANAYLKGITGNDPILMAYPYGAFNADAEAAAQENGIKYALKVGYPNQGDFAMGRHYMMRSTTLSQFAAMVGGPAPAEEPDTDTVTVYHETFAAGKGLAAQSGSASLTPVTDKVFAGNDDGGALYVSSRANTWDAADFKFADIGLENGKTYTVTVTGYVDADVNVPEGAQAYLQTVNSYSWLAGADFAAGSAFTMTKEFTVDTSKDSAIRVQSSEDGKSVPFYIGDILITAKKAAAAEREVYHESFASGNGLATQSGGASLTPVTGKAFAGNDDGAALYVSNRANTWDAADFKFADIGLENGKTYTATVTGFVDEDVTIPEGAQAYLQTVNSYTFLAGADFAAGSAFTLTKEFTVDTGKDSALRVQSSEDGKTVPFYIGDIRITEKASSGGGEEEPPRPPAQDFNTITFENEELGGFEGRAGTETLTITNEANHTEGGSYALKVENRSNTWHGPALRVEKYVDKGYEYKISVWVKLISPESSQLQLSTQVGSASPSYNNLTAKTISTSDGWVLYEGTYRYTSVSDEFLTIYVESSNNSTASFYIDDISFESTGSGPVEIEKDLVPIKDQYQDDFLIGNAVSSADLSGVRLELLKMHHNVVTAENAMKPDYAYDSNRQFDFTAEDELVAAIEEQGLLLHGHVLVWHQQMPLWLSTEADGTTPLSRDTALENLRTHIETVMEHFGDKVISWDVVNEAMNDNPPNPADWKASLRNSPWKAAIGDDYVEQAFLIAREVLDAHPEWDDIKLYYNDYNDDNQNKATAIANMVKELNDKYAAENDGKLLIDGVGMQAHYNLNTKPENVEASLKRFIDLGVEVSVTEIDITAGADSELSDKQAKAQGYLYAQLMKIYKKYADHIARVTFWGLNDATSWRASQSPLLFDKDLKAKPAYHGVIDPDTFIAENPPEAGSVNQTTAKFGTPVIDGTIDGIWSQTASIPINRYQMAWQGANGTAKALWDNDYLYVLFEVSNAELDKTSANPWEQDSVEVFLDQNNGKTTSYQEDDGQYRVNYDNETSFNPASIAEGFVSAAKVSGTNYTVELKIPLNDVTPAKGTKLGFDVQINDGKNGARQSAASWNDTTGQGYQDTSVFGVLTLTDNSDTPSGSIGGGYTPPAGSVEQKDGSVTIKPEVKNDGNRVIGHVSGENLKKALELASSGDGGIKQIAIEVPSQANANAYEVQLPSQSLKGQDRFILSVKTGNGTIEIPSNMLSNVPANGEQVSIRVAKAPTDGLDAATREQIGDRPVLDLSVVVGNETIAWNNPDAPVTISVPYTPTEEELSHPDSIVVWYIADNGDVTPIPNGRYNKATGAVIFKTTHFSTYAVASVVKSFGDLHDVPWAKQAIEAMAARDVVKGTSADSFSPHHAIKRADFIALLVRALELQASGENEAMFSDVQATGYYYEELVIAAELGIAAGYGDGTFKPDQPISRQDMMALTARALAAAGIQLKGSDALSAYADADTIAEYALDSAAALTEAGIVNGKNGKIAPNDMLTRAEAAVILYRIWSL